MASDNATEGLDPVANEAYKNQSVGLKFSAQLASALSGATFFAVLSVIGNALITTHSAVSAGAAAAGGHAGAAAVATAAAGHTAATAAATTVAGHSLFAGLATAFAGINLPVALGLMVIGIGCIYLATHFYQKAQILDCDFNAKKYAAANHKCKAQAQEKQIACDSEKTRENNTPHPYAPIINTEEAARAEAGSEKNFAAKVAPRDQAADWADRIQARPAAEVSVPAL